MESPVVRPADSIRELRNGTGAVLLDMGRGTCYSMNPAGARIWQLLRLNYSSEQIVDALAAASGADEDRVRKDVIEYTENLRRNGLLRASAPLESWQSVNRFTSAIRRFISSFTNRHAVERKP